MRKSSTTGVASDIGGRSLAFLATTVAATWISVASAQATTITGSTSLVGVLETCAGLTPWKGVRHYIQAVRLLSIGNPPTVHLRSISMLPLHLSDRSPPYRGKP
jgi:hypothetical protein